MVYSLKRVWKNYKGAFHVIWLSVLTNLFLWGLDMGNLVYRLWLQRTQGNMPHYYSKSQSHSAFEVAGRSGFHSQTVIHRWSLNDSLSSFVPTPDCFSAAGRSTKGKFGSSCCRMKRLRVSVAEPSAGRCVENIFLRVDQQVMMLRCVWCLKDGKISGFNRIFQPSSAFFVEQHFNCVWSKGAVARGRCW